MYTVMTIHTIVLCADGITILMSPCVLFDNACILPYRMNVYTYHMCIPVLAPYDSVGFLLSQSIILSNDCC